MRKTFKFYKTDAPNIMKAFLEYAKEELGMDKVEYTTRDERIYTYVTFPKEGDTEETFTDFLCDNDLIKKIVTDFL